MKLKVFVILSSLLCVSVSATETDIKISEANYKHLGIVLGKLEPVSQMPFITAPATVIIPPKQDYVVSTPQVGLVTKLNAAIGDKVKKGEVLVELNSPDLLAMQRLYLKALSDLELVSLFFQRDKKMAQEGVIAERRLQETSAQYRAAALEANERKQLLQSAGMTDAEIARLANSKKLTGQLNLHSPITGTVMERMALVGERMNSLAPVYRIADLNALWLEINVPQERASHLKIGDAVQIENTDTTAKVSLIAHSVNAENQTVLARAVIQGKSPRVRAGQHVNIQINQQSESVLFKVPNTAIAQNEGKAYVFVRNEAGFLPVGVTVMGKKDEQSIISGELSVAKDLAVQGAVALKANWLGLGSAE